MNETEKQARTILQTLGAEHAQKLEAPEVLSADPSEPQDLSREEIRLAMQAAHLLDIRSMEEVWRFLRCVEGLTHSLQKTRTEIILGMCAGEIGATNGWEEDGVLEIRHYVLANMIPGERRESRILKP